MTIIKDLRRPLNQVENVFLRRTATIILAIPIFIIIVICSLFGDAICDVIDWFEINW